MNKEQEDLIKEIGNGENYVAPFIRAKFPDLFKPKFEVGKWYKSDKDFFRVAEIGEKYVAIDNSTFKYTDSFEFNSRVSNNSALATPSEIQSHLERLAEKKGYVKGIKVKCLVNDMTYVISNKKHNNPLGTKNQFWIVDVNGEGVMILDENGKWATILSSPKELTLKEIAEKFGVDEVKIIEG